MVYAVMPYLAQAGCEHHNLIYLAHLLQEVVDTRALDDIHIMPVILDLNRDDIIRLLDGLKLASLCQ